MCQSLQQSSRPWGRGHRTQWVLSWPSRVALFGTWCRITAFPYFVKWQCLLRKWKKPWGKQVRFRPTMSPTLEKQSWKWLCVQKGDLIEAWMLAFSGYGFLHWVAKYNLWKCWFHKGLQCSWLWHAIFTKLVWLLYWGPTARQRDEHLLVQWVALNAWERWKGMEGTEDSVKDFNFKASLESLRFKNHVGRMLWRVWVK